MKTATIVYITRPGTHIREVLLALKSKVVGVGKRFGYGGKIKDGESATRCTVRETEEESGGITIEEKNLNPMAIIDFYKDDMPFGNPFFRVLFYVCDTYRGKASSTDEMKDPEWFSVDNLPFHEMKAGDELVVPFILHGQMRKGWIRFNGETEELIAYEVTNARTEDLVM